jgi:hypothetical protein
MRVLFSDKPCDEMKEEEGFRKPLLVLFKDGEATLALQTLIAPRRELFRNPSPRWLAPPPPSFPNRHGRCGIVLVAVTQRPMKA